MARIRTIKPELPQSESMGRISRDARLCFILMWTIADDAGRLRGASRMLASLLYPYDDDAPALMEGWLAELERERCIVRYEVDGSSYIQVAKWLEHQKIDRPSKSKLPCPIEGSRGLANDRESSSGDLGPRTKEEEGNNPPTPPCAEAEASDGEWMDQLGSVDRVLVAVWMQSGATADDCRKWLVSTKGQGRDKVAAWLKLGATAADLCAKIPAVFDEAEHRGQPINQPWPYLDKVIRAWVTERKTEAQTDSAGGIGWPTRLVAFRDQGIWLGSWGEKPGHPRCQVPAEILAEHGYGDPERKAKALEGMEGAR